MTTGLFFQCVCLVCQWQCQFAAAAAAGDDDDDKVANDALLFAWSSRYHEC